MKKKILLLGSGELGKEFVIAAQRLGQHVVAVDSYEGAPAMQVAHEFEVIDMLNGDALDKIVTKHRPDIIVPEIEAIRTERFYEYEKQGYQVVPSAKAANYTMNRKSIRDLAAKEIGVKTAKYLYANSLPELQNAVTQLGLPCVVKPLMSSSGKGQSVIRTEQEIETAWIASQTKGRTGASEIIVEEFIPFDSEITLLTVTQKSGKTLFCPPIGHRQERGDYQESWQPAEITDQQLNQAQDMAARVTKELGGTGIWGVEFFLTKDEVYFSELSPRPHDTGMVTLAGTQTFSEFELHLRAILGLPIPEIQLVRKGASAVILSDSEGKVPEVRGLDIAAEMPESDFRIFGKPVTRKYRRMGVALAYSDSGESISSLRKRAVLVASKVKV
ncbi:phosphoribosylglycinamide formyltransferase 2 [Leptospira perolatii]|uniref:Formate-dependent phosphoribosylglycinamide formyltransferase n=1 Tax=Leptospira perolatii TaxID=2023191 RepID=A0A2M9ZT14_9LEPT|nr:formate-dependent phosphoribosylglycinamide formyltransferase [Leptospira perolatii]PJZ71538.1 phosphoribosylglycinamide formyltransferase 2 [Leptospira perolatii]PJZ75155.1 phosphoribosylglycinamide formyltransferase 2 [Leptospira perolatii]